MKSGFTLVELMIVVIIIGILAAIAIPKFSSIKTQAVTASCRSNIRVLASAEAIYFGLQNSYTVSLINLRIVQDNAPLLCCPYDGTVYVLADPTGNGYSITCVSGTPHGSFVDGISSWQ